MNLSGCSHADCDDAGQEAGGDSKPGAFRNIVHAGNDLDAGARFPREALEQGSQGLCRSLDPCRNDTASDYTRFQQAEIVAGKVEDFGNGGDVGGSLQIDTGQPYYRLVNHPEPSFDWRLRMRKGLTLSTDSEIDGYIDDTCPFREIHSKEENIAPSAVREVHADGRDLTQNRENRFACK